MVHKACVLSCASIPPPFQACLESEAFPAAPPGSPHQALAVSVVQAYPPDCLVKPQLEKYRPHCFYGDGYEGLPTYAPFNKIIVTAGAESIPEKLVQQLSIGGKMVIPTGDSDSQRMLLVEKNSEDNIEITEHGAFMFVPMLKGKV